MKKILFSSALVLAAAFSLNAQVIGEDILIHKEIGGQEVRTEINIPDVDGYKVLKGDFHLHTIYSDGCVTPDFRVREAWYNGLDVIAITDHIEVLRHDDIFDMKKFNFNMSNEIAMREAKGYGLILVPGTEITRSKPFGHMNALFVTDANKADKKDQMDALNAMVEQGAYILWNHPGWPDDLCTMYPIHEELIAKGIIKGVEIFNDVESYPIAYDWVEEYGLHPFANSDAHGPVDAYYKGLRPMTLVFAKDKSLEGVKEAMFAGRMLAFFSGNIVGTKELVSALAQECLEVKLMNNYEQSKSYIITNKSDIPFVIEAEGWQSPLVIGPGKSVKDRCGYDEVLTISNCFYAKGECLSLPFKELVD